MLRFILITILFNSCINLFSSELESDSIVSVKKVFYKMGTNTLNTFTYNYGLNICLATVGTYGLVNSGFDWHWNRLAYDNKSMAYSGMPSVIIGGLVPMIVPAGIYFYGRKHRNVKTQVTGLALLQAAILGAGITSSIKTFTGRKPPGILEKTHEKENYSTDYKFGIFRRGAFDGWPSGHTTTAFAMAVTLTELYPDNFPLKIGALSYATLIGLGVSVNIHWFSDAFAGVFLGYALGKSIGASFKQLLNNNTNLKYSFYFAPGSAKYVLYF